MTDTSPVSLAPLTGPQRAVRSVEAVVRILSKTALVGAGLTVAAIFALVCASVVARYAFNQPQPWIDEAVGWLLVMSVMLALPEVQRRGDHIGIDTLATRLSEAQRPRLAAFGLVFVVVAAVIVLVEGLEMVEFSRMVGVLSNRIPEVPLWMVQALVPFGFGLLLLVAATQLLTLLVGLKPRDMAETVHGEPA